MFWIGWLECRDLSEWYLSWILPHVWDWMRLVVDANLWMQTKGPWMATFVAMYNGLLALRVYASKMPTDSACERCVLTLLCLLCVPLGHHVGAKLCQLTFIPQAIMRATDGY